MSKYRISRILGLTALAAATLFGPRAASAAPPSIGMNIGSVYDYTAEIAFADAQKQARVWKDVNEGFNITFDANGWPQQDCINGVWYQQESNISGTYAISFNGQATLTSGPDFAITNQSYNSGTNTTTATLTVDTNPNAQGFFELKFTNTKRTSSSGTNTGLTNLKIMRPSTEGGSTPIASSVTFMPSYEAEISKAGTIRFMGYSNANGNTSVNWADRTKPTFDTQQCPNGAAWEYAVQLCNETGKDMYINVPVNATDDYITKLAQLIKYGTDGNLPYTSTQASPVFPPLNASLHVYVEYCNEIWNTAGPFIYDYLANTSLGNAEIWHYPITTNGLAASIANGPISSVADGLNGLGADAAVLLPAPWLYDPGFFSGGWSQLYYGNTIDTSAPNAAPAVIYQGWRQSNGSFTYTIPGLTPNASYTVRLHYAELQGRAVGAATQEVSINGINVLHNFDVVAAAGAPNKAVVEPFTATSNGSGQIIITVSASINSGHDYVSLNGIQILTGSTAVDSIACGQSYPFPTSTWPTNRNVFRDVVFNGATSVFTSQTPTSTEAPGTGGFANSELGMKFKSTQAGQITALRYYKVSGETGTHRGHLWDAAGNILAVVNFTNETSSGWQSATLSPAVNIAANTTYVVSVNANTLYGYIDSLQLGPLTFDGNMWSALTRHWTERTLQISNLFRGIFGDAAMMTQVRPVLESQEYNEDRYLHDQIGYLEDYFNTQSQLTTYPDGAINTAKPPTYYIYGGGGAAYYDPASGNSHYDINTIWTSGDFYVPTWTAICQNENNYVLPAWGHRVAYEGGPNLVNNQPVDSQAVLDTRMTNVLTNNQIAWDQSGGGLLMYFIAIGDYHWGFTSDIYNLTTPKLTALNQMNASTQATATYGAAIPATIGGSSYSSPHFADGTNIANMSAAGPHTWVGYVVSNATAGVFTIALSAGSAGATNQADIYVDGQLTGTINIANTGSNTTYATSSSVATPSLAIGSHGILVKVKTGSFGFNAVLITGGGTPPIPNAPTGLTATPNNGRVSLNWAYTTYAASYNIYRSTTAGGEGGTPIVTGVLSNSYTNLGLTNGTTYYYKVTAMDSAGESPKSAEVSATPVDNTAHMQQTSTAPVIDGNIDTVWNSATSYSLTHSIGTVQSGQTISASYQSLWDNNNAYFLVTVLDSALVANSNPGNGDSVEIYLDGDNSKSASYDGDDWQYVFPWNSSTIYEYQGGTPGSHTAGMQFSQVNISGGYRMEIAIPWTTIGVAPSANNLMGLDVAINNSDTLGTRCNKLFWWSTQDNNWTNPSLFGTGTLVGAASSATASYVKLDTATQGNWKSTYGLDGYNVFLDPSANNPSYPSYATVSATGNSLYTWAASTTDVRGLQKAAVGGTDRIAAQWLSATTFDIDCNLTDGNTHQVTLYALDWDDFGGGNGRTQTIQVLDASTLAVLDTRNLTLFQNGQYVVWTIKGHVKFHVINTGPGNCTVSGIFFGAGTGGATASFVKTDTTTQGNWKGNYGANGYNVINDPSAGNPKYPSYATVSTTAWTFTYAASSSDVRALTKSAPLSTDRIAAQMGDASNFYIDCNITDGGVHQVAVYALDWDHTPQRNETIAVIDANTSAVLNTQTISNFINGTYLVWNISGHVKFHIINNGGNNCTISGLFFGPGNLAQNPGFETGTFASWAPYGANSITTTAPHSGTYAGTLSAAVSGADQIVTGLSPNTAYTLTAWMKNAVSGEQLYLGVKNYGGTETNIVTTGTTYTQLSVSFTTGATNTTADIYGYKATGSGASYIDDYILAH